MTYLSIKLVYYYIFKYIYVGFGGVTQDGKNCMTHSFAEKYGNKGKSTHKNDPPTPLVCEKKHIVYRLFSQTSGFPTALFANEWVDLLHKRV